MQPTKPNDKQPPDEAADVLARVYRTILSWPTAAEHETAEIQDEVK